MKLKRTFITMVFALSLTFAGCGTRSSSTSIWTEHIETESETDFIRVKPQSVLFHEYKGLKDIYGYEPFYSAGEWMDGEGRLLFPYEEYRYRMNVYPDVLASLDMPEEVLKKAQTKDILEVVCGGWLTSGATAADIYNFPSQYVNIASANVGAVNELLWRSDMASAVWQDYYKRNYLVGEGDYGSVERYTMYQIIFDEILLASNLAFSQMDDRMKALVLDGVMKKLHDVESGEYFTSSSVKSGFFAFIAEEYAAGGSLWYDYISDNCPEEIKRYLTKDFMDYWHS